MNIKDKIIIVTGGANGIGKALCQRFVSEQAARVIIVDLELDSAQQLADELGADAMQADVSKESDIQAVVSAVEAKYGQIDLYCSNAGVFFSVLPDWQATSLANEQWQKIWEINVMSHIYGARAVLPSMQKRGDGYILNTVSAAGLLSQIGSAAYSTTKHAALGFSESLAITHGDEGIKVSVLCPQAVDTRMVAALGGGGVAGVDGVLPPTAVADSVVQGIADEHFMILPHKEVATYFQHKAGDYERWITGMRKLRDRFLPNMKGEATQ